MALGFGKNKDKNKDEKKGEQKPAYKPRTFDREERITLQKMVTTVPVTRKMLSQELLVNAIASFISRNVRMGSSAAYAVNNALEPEVFFTNLELVTACTTRIAQLEPYWKFDGKQPHEQLEEITQNRKFIIGAFVERSFFDTLDKIKKKSSPKAKQKIFDEYQTALLKYQEYIDEENLEFFRKLCEENIK